LMGVLVFDLLPGLVIAVALSLVLFIAYASQPRIAELRRKPNGDFAEVEYYTDLSPIPGLLIIRPDGGLFFGNATRVRHAVTDLVSAAPTRPRALFLALNSSYRLGLPVLDALGELEEDLRRGGTELWLVDVHASALGQLAADPLMTRLGDDRVWPDISAAAERFSEGTGPHNRQS
jgi:SulP family sulfate permease